MTLARIQLLPANHPLAVMISERQLLTAHTWWEQARDWLSSLQLPGELPSIFNCGIFSKLQLLEASRDSTLRKNLLKQYRHSILRPLLLKFEASRYFQAATKPLEGLQHSPLDLNIIHMNWRTLLKGAFLQRSATWLEVRCWSLARITGRWPLPLFGTSSFPVNISCKCGHQEASVWHALCQCPRTVWCFQILGHFDKERPERLRTTAFLQYLFGDAATTNDRRFCLVANYVLHCLQSLSRID